MRLFTTVLDTPIGPLNALASDEGLCALEFTSTGRSDKLERRRRKWFPEHTIEEGETVVTRLTRGWLDDFFAGRPLIQPRLIKDAGPKSRTTAEAGPKPRGQAGLKPRTTVEETVLPLTMYGTEFELKVWAALLEIPAGETTSYGDIARRLGAPNASRAVGLANGANPIPLIVPCHRVIGSNGSLVGYGGGMPRKRWLLDHERSRYSRNLLNAAAL